MTTRDFAIIVIAVQGTVPVGTYTDVVTFDPDDIYDASLASDIRAMAREALVAAGERESADLR